MLADPALIKKRENELIKTGHFIEFKFSSTTENED